MKLTVSDDTGETDDGAETFTLGTAPPPPPAPVTFVGQATRNSNTIASTVAGPGLRPCAGDALLLFASRGGNTALTGPGAGWTQIGKVTDGEG